MESINEVTIESDFLMESYYADDSYRDFFNELKRYRLLSNEENQILVLQAQSGNQDALNKLVKHNLRLVVSISKKFTYRINHLQVLDLIQEGCIGLINSVPGYDPEKGAFTTYVVPRITQAMDRALKNLDPEIRVPIYTVDKRAKYFYLIEEYKKANKEIPSDEKLCEILEIPLETLELIRHSLNIGTISLQTKINNDENQELETMLGKDDDSYERVLDEIDENVMYVVLKEVLNPYEYYVIYHRYLSDTKIKLEALGKAIGVSRERIRQVEARAIKKIKPYLKSGSKVYTNKIAQLTEECKNLNYYSSEPISPLNVAKFIYLKDELDELERKVLYYKCFGRFKLEYYRNWLKIDKNDFQNILCSIRNKLQRINDDVDKFNEFRSNLIKSRGSKIFCDAFEEDFKILDYGHLEELYGHLSYEEIIVLLNQKQIEVTESDKKALLKYFRKVDRAPLTNSLIEKEIYLLSFGCKDKSSRVSPKKLLPTFLKYKEKFNEEQKLFLECFYFKTKRMFNFLTKYPESSLLDNSQWLFERLEKLHYNCYHLFDNTFNKDKYLLVKEKYARKLSLERIKLLDLFYGVNGREYTIAEIAEMYDEDYVVMHDKIRSARDYVINLYNNRTASLLSDMSIYIPHLNDDSIELTEETRKVMYMFIVEGLEYSEISKIMGVNNSRVSNLITDGLRRIDFYRYGIITKSKITSNEFVEFLKSSFNSFNTLEQKIIFLRKCKLYNPNQIVEQLGIDKDTVSSVIYKFNKAYRRYQIKDVKLDEKDILNELNGHPSESILDDISKRLLSLYFGFNTRYNEDNVKLRSEETAKTLNITMNVFYHKLQEALDKIKAKKINVERADLCYIERTELDKLLDDVHLPISDADRELICYLFGLKGYTYKSIEELVLLYNDKKAFITRRYQRAILAIFKYVNKEIDGNISYEVDIKPNLKYFSKSDCQMIEDYFKDHLTYEQIAKKYDFTFNQIVNIFSRLKNNLYDLLNEEDIQKFDFEFYRKNKDNLKLPFFGNRELAIEVFDLYFGENDIKKLSVVEIIETLNLDSTPQQLTDMLGVFMISFGKLQDGTSKKAIFSDREIMDYYMNHLDMDVEHKRMYLKYFKEKEKRKVKKGYYAMVNYTIMYDLLKEKYPDFFDITKATRMQIMGILKKYNDKLINSVRESLMVKYDITERMLMNNYEINRVFSILNMLEVASKKSQKSSKLTRIKDIDDNN